MGFTELTFENYIEQPDYWFGWHGVTLPSYAKELAERGYKGVSAIDFYDDLFGEELEPERLPEDYRSGEYAAIAVELLPDGVDKQGNPKFKGQRTTITQGQQELYDLIDSSDNFCMMSAVSYAGKQRTNKNARYLFALVIEIDDINGESGINELIYSWQRKAMTMPQPTYIVCSGTGLHLYYVFERPVPLFAHIIEQMSQAKKYFTERLWNKYVTTAHEKIQYESVNQPFRCVGTRCKDNSSCAMAFQTGEKITLEYLNKLLPANLRVDAVYKSKLTLAAAKERYPVWYQRRIVEKKERGHWTRHEGIYHNWIKKVRSGAVVGKRYNCLENLCSLAVQCNIAPEQVEQDCRELAEHLETLTVDEKNHFTEYDILCALKTYHERSDGAYRRKIEYVANKTGITLIPNKRNGRKRSVHVQLMNRMRSFGVEMGECTNGGRPIGSGTADQRVAAYRSEHPDASVTEVARALGISRTTAYKWWDAKRKFEPWWDEVDPEWDLSEALAELAEAIARGEEKIGVDGYDD